jgi:hypothetical protein
VVGIAQRRTKDAARFQCTVYRSIDVALYSSLLRNVVASGLGEAAGVGEKLSAIASAVVRRLSEALG